MGDPLSSNERDRASGAGDSAAGAAAFFAGAAFVFGAAAGEAGSTPSSCFAHWSSIKQPPHAGARAVHV